MDLQRREKRLLSNLICSLSLSDTWNEEVRNLRNVLDVDEELSSQLLYEVVAKECRHLWGVQRLYKGESLREPYLRQYHKKEHVTRLTHQLQMKITKTALLHRKTKPAENYHNLQNKLRKHLSHYVAILSQAQCNDVYELLGASLVDSFQKYSPIPKLLTVPLQPLSPSLIAPTTDKKATSTPVTTKRSLPFLSAMDGRTDTVSKTWNYQAVEQFCGKYQGHLLPDTLRRPLWLARLLRRHWDDLPAGPPLVDELSRLGVAKGMPSAPYIVPAALEELVSRTVDYLLQKCFPSLVGTSASPSARVSKDLEIELRQLHTKMSMSKVLLNKHAKRNNALNMPSPPNKKSQLAEFRPTSGNNKIKALKKRIQLMTSAMFVITGTISDRTASIALFLMTLFPDESPVSEAMLQLHHNITVKYLPSEQLHRSYSNASVALDAWSMLHREDGELHQHLEKYATFGTEMDKRYVGKQPQQPTCYTLLLPWLNAGFIGVVSEYVGMFIWDQLVMWGTRSEDFAQLIPNICVVLLKLIRSELLSALTREDLITVMATAPMRLRSKDFFVSCRLRLAKMRRRQDIMNEYLPFRNGCATTIQRMFRGMMGRKYVRALRHALAQGTMNDYMDTDSKVRAWLEDSQRYQAMEAEKRRRINEAMTQRRGQENARNTAIIFSSWKKQVSTMKSLEEKVVAERKLKLTKLGFQSFVADVQHSRALDKLLAEHLQRKEQLFLPSRFSAWKNAVATDIITRTMNRMLESIETDTKYDSILDNFEFESKSVGEFDSDEEEANMYLDIQDKRKSYSSSSNVSPRLNEEEELAIMVDVMDVIDTMVDALCFEEENKEEPAIEGLVSRDEEEVVLPMSAEPAIVSMDEAPEVEATRRDEVAAVINSLLSSIENLQMVPQASTTSLASTNTASTEDVDQFDSTHIPELRKILHTEMLKPLAVVAKGMSGQKRTLGTVRNMLKRASVLGQVTNALNASTIPLDDENDDKFFSISDKYRRNIRPIEIDALQGFFMDQRELIGDLVEEKRIVKHFIQQWKDDFAKKNKGKEPSAAHKKEISDAYKKYHELTQELKIKIQELRISEDELLISWNKDKSANMPS